MPATPPNVRRPVLTGWKDFGHAVFVAVVFHTCYLVLPFIILATPFFIYYNFGSFWWLSIVYTAAYILYTFDGSEYRSGRHWEWFCNLWVWRVVFSWFPLKLFRSKESKGKRLDPNEQYMFVVHPHGMLALGRVAFSMIPDAGSKESKGKRLDPNEQYMFVVHPHGMLALGRVAFSMIPDQWNKLFPGIRKRSLTATAAFFIPFIRELWLWTECVDASRQTADHCLSEKGGRYSLCVYPGGEREQLLTQTHKYRVFLKHRKGFVRLALRHGTPLIPVIAFGETSLYNALHWLLGELRIWIAKRTRISFPVFTGKFIVLPHRAPLSVVVGSPMEIPHIPHPTDADVAKWHAKYIDALSKMFEEEKGTYGYPSAELEIL
eukprot:TRINITY_DN2260_c0_g1_i1.p1 TRINITY_DN2260_c0_g1~~TRINITY_DN2260_c0_g1_i1.p1  ORF type:complete len:377 (+),score=67.00 TRINITY_DN2260_c0_g1_i1:151-1281(+)